MMIKKIALVAALGVPVAVAMPSFDFVARHYFPAGYAEGTTSGVPDLYGYGFGALERSYYDASQQVFYGGSETGFVTVSDFSLFPEVTVADFGIPLENGFTDLKVCGDLLFVSTKDDPNPGSLLIYKAASRNDDGSFNEPALIQSVELGVGPDMVLVSKDCSTVATANEGEGDYDGVTGLVNPEGSVSIVRGPFDDASNPPVSTLVTLDKWTDEELIEMGVHLPLSLNAMKYWNASEDIDVDFTAAMESYTTASVLEPEYLAWSGDESKIYVNLQENNAMIIVDVATNEALSIHAYGLKDWSVTPIDIVEDDTCALAPVEGLYSLRLADGIASYTVDGVDYIITANEGDDVEYGDYEEKQKGKDIFDGMSLAFAGMTADEAIFSTMSITEGTSRFFNGDCDEEANPMETPFCSGSMRFSIGSSMVDYSDPTAPNIYRLTALGGRGASIYKVTDGGLELVWDSEDAFEREGCAAFGWAHNGIQDEEYAPVGGPFYNSLPEDDGLRETIDEVNDPEEDGCADGGDGNPGACPLGATVDERSLKDGPAPETVVVGKACGTTYMATVTEKNSIGFLYDLSDVASPELVKVFHLSPASELLNPGLAYDARTLGEIDSETIQFLSVDESPTGKAAILFSGAWSGTTSLWEFNCDGPTPTTPPPSPVMVPTDAPAPTDAPEPTNTVVEPTTSDATVLCYLWVILVGFTVQVLI